MNNITYITTPASDCLREIADRIDAGEHEDRGTLILGVDVFHFGAVHPDRAAEQAVWDMTYGIHKLISAALEDKG